MNRRGNQTWIASPVLPFCGCRDNRGGAGYDDQPLLYMSFHDFPLSLDLSRIIAYNKCEETEKKGEFCLSGGLFALKQND